MNLKRRSHNYCSCDCEESECNLCEGSLYYCLVCGGVETDSLTKDCCGRMISDIEEEKISKGWLDFIDGRWKLTEKGKERLMKK